METEHITVEHLIAYAAQELTHTETRVIRDHVVVCPECNAVVLSFKNIRRLIQCEDGQDPPDATVARAYAIFQPQETRSPSYRTWLSFLRLFTIA